MIDHELRDSHGTLLNPPSPPESLALARRLRYTFQWFWDPGGDALGGEQVVAVHLCPADLARLTLCGADVPAVHVYGGQVVGIAHPVTDAVIAVQGAADLAEGMVRYECVMRSE